MLFRSRNGATDGKPRWLTEAVESLAETIQRRINASVAISPCALVSMVLLATPRQAMVESDLVGQLDLCRELARRLPYSADASCTELEGAAMIAAAFYPKDVIIRMSDFKSNEYANLLGGRSYEPLEENPMIGFRGASRYYDSRYQAAFALECRAMRDRKSTRLNSSHT